MRLIGMVGNNFTLFCLSLRRSAFSFCNLKPRAVSVDSINLLFCSSFARPCHCLLRPLKSRFYLSCHCEAMSFTFMAVAISPLHYNGDKDPFLTFPQSQRQKGIKTINRIASSGCALLAMTDQRKVVIVFDLSSQETKASQSHEPKV